MKNIRTQLADFGKNLLDRAALAEGMDYISANAKTIIGAERCSIFIYNHEDNELWTTIADGTEKIVIPYDIGICGQTIRAAKPIIENEPYDNANFLSDIDMQTGYYTRNILTSPIFDSKREIIGVLQLLNKEGGFHKKDLERIASFSEHVSRFIERNGAHQTPSADNRGEP